MKYKYYDKGGRLIAESDSPIQFNVARFPTWRNLKLVVEEAGITASKVTDKVTKNNETSRVSKKKKEGDK
ncbi:MAG: hypothetical protein DRP09_13795 [Candidatus Thorarchaeota archaeon]|nr:MAG: hypothetical protein DRP09_13795 [Candidatus Thorarchaeota archaeon]